MSSSVFFKFKSQREPQRVAFDGSGISVFELKRDIISISRLGDGTDFDLSIYNSDSNDAYDDDTALVPRGTTVVARRLPASKPGAGRAARYVSGKMPVMAKNQHRIEASKNPILAKASDTNHSQATNGMSEEEKIAAMFAQGGEQWEQQQQQMANQKAIHRGGFQKSQAVPDKPLPVGYTCHRCGEKGHWIQACPTNNDPNFDNRPKFKRTTGIPRSFLKVVDKPAGFDGDGSVDVSNLPPGVMYTATGEWVVAEPDKAAWDKYQAQAKASADKAEAQSSDVHELRERGLECPVDKRLLVDPMKTPCCGQTYCRDCIENALLSNDFVCPGCNADNILVDNLVSDEDAVDKIKAYQEEKAASVKVEKATSKSPIPEGKPSEKTSSEKTAARSSKSPTSKSVNAMDTGDIAAVKSVTPIPIGAPGSPKSTTSESKKRKAEDPLNSARVPTAPAAMRRNQQQQPQQNVPPQMDDFVQHMNMMAQQQGMGMFPQMPMGFNNTMPMNPMMGMPNPMMMMNGGGWGGFPQQQQQQYHMQGGGYNSHTGGRGGGYGQQWQGNRGRGGNYRR